MSFFLFFKILFESLRKFKNSLFYIILLFGLVLRGGGFKVIYYIYIFYIFMLIWIYRIFGINWIKILSMY